MSGGVPAGWVLVPVEPTEAMRDAGHAAYSRILGGASDVYRAMLAAVPAPPCQCGCEGDSFICIESDGTDRATPTPPIEGRDADVERVDMQVITDAVRYAKQVLAQVYTRKDRKMTSVASSNVNTAAHRLAAALQALGERG